MAEGKGYYDESGDFSQDFDDLSRYSQEDQEYMRANSKTRLNGQTLDDGKNTAGFGKFGRKKDEDGNNKWGLLKKGEKDASEKPNSKGKGGDKKASLGEKENNVKSDANKGENGEEQSDDGRFKNAVKGVKALKSGKAGEAKGRFKKAGPIVAILALCCGFGGASFLGQLSMPFSLIAQLKESYDSISVSQGMRSKVFLRYQTINKGVKGCIKAHYYRPDEFKVSNKQKNKLQKAGITFETDSDGVTVMKHTGVDGTVRTVVADESLAGNGRIYFADLYESDVSFRNSYDSGSRTWRGSVGAWFDSSMKKLLSFLGVNNRNKWDGYKANSDGDNSEMRSRIANDVDSDSAGGKARTTHPTERTEEIEGPDGNPTTRTNMDFRDENALKTDSDATLKRSDVKIENGKVDSSGLKAKLRNIASNLGSASSLAVTISCTVGDIVGGIASIVAAYQMNQVIKLASEIFEGIQKAQAGDGSESPINGIGESLIRPATSTYQEVKTVKKVGNNEFDADEVSETTRTRSAMEANAISATYGQTAIDPSDPSVKSFNVNSLVHTVWKAFSDGNSGILGALTSSLAGIAASLDVSSSAFKSCTIARAGAAVVSLIGDVVETVADCLTPPGLGCVKKLVKNAAKQIATSALLSIAVSTIVSIAVPHVTKVLTRSIATEVVGEDLGNALVSGANAYMGENHKYSGGATANKESLMAYLQQKDIIVANEARFERETRSPFDITSKYTFLGSIASQMIPIASQMTSVTGALKGVGDVVGSAVKSLMPYSSAVSAGIEAQVAAENTEYNCPYMDSVGAVADAFCNPYIITDVTTMEEDPGQVVNNVDAYGGLKDVADENAANVPEIDEDSKLAKYIVYCGQRTSPLGFADQNIASEVDTAGSVGGTVGQAVIGGIPVVGDVVDLMSADNKLDNMGWISGESCVIGNNVGTTAQASISWEEAKEYQRFIEDQRLAEAEGIIEESAVTKYLSSYYEKHPIDNSYEGMLARYSGLTKERVVAILDFIEVAVFASEYDPSDYYPYRQEQPFDAEEEKMEFEDNQTAPSTFALIYNTMFDNKRYRNFAA